jgi:Flp pilus assembly protein TadG
MKSEKGQSMVETALLLPLILLLLFGIVDFGRAFHAYLTLDHAGREAARYASIGRNNADVTAKVYSSIIGLDPSKLATPQINRITIVTGETNVSITLTYTFNFLTPVLNLWSIPLKDTTVMRIE